MKKATLNELNEKYMNTPYRTSKYEIDGKQYIVKSHFAGSKNLDDVLYRLSFQRALAETLKTA